jgi:hypothetical protein
VAGPVGEVRELEIGSVGGMGVFYDPMELAAFGLGLTASFSENRGLAGRGN